MATRGQIEAGRAVIVVDIQNKLNESLKGVEKQLKKFANAVGQIGFDVFRGGLVGSIPAFASLNEFMKFEDEILRLGTKLNSTEAQLRSVEKTIRQLGKTTSFTALEVATGATSLAQAGLTPGQVEKGLQAVLDLGRGARITLDESADLLANTSKTFKIPVDRFGEIASQFIVAARLSTIEVSNLKESIKEVSGTLNDLNVDLPTSLALLNQLGFRSLKGTKAGTTLNTMLLNFVNNSQKIAKFLNVDLEDSKGNIRKITDVIGEFGTKISELKPARRAQLSQYLFNIRGSRGETALREMEAVVKMAEEIRTAGDEARRAAEKMDSGLGGSVRRATSAVNDLAISLGQKLAPAVRYVLDLVPALAASLDDVVQKFPIMTATILSIPPGMVVAGAAMLGFGFVLSKMAGLIGVFTTSISGLITLLRNSGDAVTTGLTSPFTAAYAVAKSVDQKLAKTIFGSGRGRKKRPKSLLSAQIPTFQLNQKLLKQVTALGSKGFNLAKSGVGLGVSAFNLGIDAIANTVKLLARGVRALVVYNKAMALLLVIQQKIGNARYLKTLFQIMARNGTMSSASAAAAIAKLNAVLSILIARQAKLQLLLKSFSIGNQLKVLGSLFKKGSVAVIDALAIAIRKGLSGAFTTLIKSLNFLLRGNWITSLYKGFLNIGKGALFAVRGILSFGKFLFSFNGLFTVIQLLVLFGDKLDFTKKILDGFRAGFGQLGKAFVRIGIQSQTAFAQIGSGINLIFAGQGGAGVEALIAGISNLSSIITNNLLAGFNRFIQEIGPGLDFIYRYFLALWGLLQQIGSVVGSLLAPLQEIGKTSDSSISKSLSEIFSTENMIEGFKELSFYVEGLGQAIVSVAVEGFKILSTAVKYLTDTFASILNVYSEFVRARSWMYGSSYVAEIESIVNRIKTGGRELAYELNNVSSKMENASGKIANAGNAFRDRLDEIATTTTFSDAANERAKVQEAAARAAANRATISALFNNTVTGLSTLGDSAIALGQVTDRLSFGMVKLSDTMFMVVSGVGVNQELNGWQDLINRALGFVKGRATRNTTIKQAVQAAGDIAANALTNPKGAIGGAMNFLGQAIKNPIATTANLLQKPIADAAASAGAAIGKLANGEDQLQTAQMLGSVVGSFQETRGRLMAAKSEPEKQTELLKNISSGLHDSTGTTTSPYLKQLLDKDTQPKFAP